VQQEVLDGLLNTATNVRTDGGRRTPQTVKVGIEAVTVAEQHQGGIAHART
jgi:hypothetical protein